MALDLSRITGAPDKHYGRVVHQQGRVHVEADLNEEQAITRYREETTNLDVIGRTGCPVGDAGFGIGMTGDNAGLTISPGRLYVDGVLAELTLRVIDATVLDAQTVTVPIWHVDGHDFAAWQWLEVRCGTADAQTLQVTTAQPQAHTLSLSGPITNVSSGDTITLRRLATYATQPDYHPTEALAPGTYRVYADVFEQDITWIQDPSIREIALGGVDTAGRTRVRAQVRLDPVPEGAAGGGCPDLFGSSWSPAVPAGRLRARIDPGSGGTGPCVLPPEAGYQGVENQLYRVQVHQGGTAGDAGVSFKWQRDNASVVSGIETLTGDTATVHDVGRDDNLSFDDQHLAEPSDDSSDLGDAPHPLQRVMHVNRATRTIQLDSTLPALDTGLHAKLQRWDAAGAITPPVADGWITLEYGLQVQFSPGRYRAGDFWLIPARTATGSDPGSIEWPVDDSQNALAQPPAGVQHHYAPLAVVHWNGEVFSGVSDCRTLFPPLTSIRPGGCTLTVVPGPGWESVFDRIGAGQDARICFQVGEYPLAERRVVEGKGNLVLEGCGDGTRVLAPTAEAALRFVGCTAVTVRGLHAETGVVGSGRGAPLGDLGGVLTFIDCPSVEVESVSLGCAAASYRGASCITVGTSPPRVGDAGTAAASDGLRSARVRGCTLTPGHQQVGILLVNQDRVQVEDCLIRAGAGLPVGNALLADTHYRDALRRLLVSSPAVYKGTPPPTAQGATTIRAGDLTLGFRTAPVLASLWPRVIDSVRGRTVQLTPFAARMVGGRLPITRIGVQASAPAEGQGTPAVQPAGVAATVGGVGPARAAAVTVATARDMLAYTRDFAHRLLTDAEFRLRWPDFGGWLSRILDGQPASASQGIVIGGQSPTEVRILNNTIRSVMMGIHVGVSHHRPRGDQNRNRTGRVLITGNTVDVLLTVDARGRHAIFGGNCDSLVVESNHVTLRRASESAWWPTDGIRIFGMLGRMVIVRQNHVVDFTTGVTLQGINKPAPTISPLWEVSDNLLATATQMNTGGGPVVAANNVS